MSCAEVLAAVARPRSTRSAPLVKDLPTGRLMDSASTIRLALPRSASPSKTRSRPSPPRIARMPVGRGNTRSWIELPLSRSLPSDSVLSCTSSLPVPRSSTRLIISLFRVSRSALPLSALFWLAPAPALLRSMRVE